MKAALLAFAAGVSMSLSAHAIELITENGPVEWTPPPSYWDAPPFVIEPPSDLPDGIMWSAGAGAQMLIIDPYVQFAAAPSVPEPASLLLLASGLATAAGVARLRRGSSARRDRH